MPPTGSGRSHLESRLRESIAEDPRVHELEIEVKAVGDRVFLMGRVASEGRRRLLEEVVSEMLPPGMRVVNDVSVPRIEESPETERLT